jgi:hypothetical protein
MRSHLIRSMIVVLLLMLCAGPASAQLERFGPVAPANGYPSWYQDKTGLSLEFCQPLNQAELDGGWCLLLAGDTTAPEVFPTSFSEEHFYWAGNATVPMPNGGSAILVLALEGAFGGGPVLAGDQIVFARIRIRFDAPADGVYTVYHPYGTEVIQAIGGERVFVTQDVGLGAGFDGALSGRIGPFLLAANAPGGAELPAIGGPVPGKLYIADPARLGPVTGSPVINPADNLPQNYFRIVGPGVNVGTNNFSLMGRVFTGAIPGRLTIDRASYALPTVNAAKLDVFASAFPTTQGHVPGQSPAPVTAPLLAFYPAPCSVSQTGTLGAPAGVAGQQMLSDGSSFYGQVQSTALPAAVCVGDLTARNAAGQIVPIFNQAPVADQVTITKALYDPSNANLLVEAVSSDAVNAPVLTVSGYGDMTSGTKTALTVAPASKVHVLSSKGGQADLLVTTTAGGSSGGPNPIPIAQNDAATVTEDSGQTSIAVLANDLVNNGPIPAGSTVAIVLSPSLGSAVVLADGSIGYTPSPNAFGGDALAYTVTVLDANGVPFTSPSAFVSITITPVNDLPVAVNDSASGVPSQGIAINVLANDSDPDGAADLVSAVVVTPPPGATAVVGAGGVITLTASAAGQYTFTYQAVDSKNARSNTATVTVNVLGNETITIVRADFIVNKLRWRVEGTSSLAAGQTMTIAYDNGSLRPLGTSLAGFVIGTATVDAAGAWTMDLILTSASDPRNPNAANTFVIRPNRIRVTSPLGGRNTAPIALR